MTQVTFEISSGQHSGGAALLTVAGELALRSPAVPRAGIVDAIDRGARRVSLDMSAVSFIDAMGLGALVGGLRRLRAVGRVLVLSCADRSVVRIFEITGRDRFFPLHPTLGDSLTHVPLNAAS